MLFTANARFDRGYVSTFFVSCARAFDECTRNSGALLTLGPRAIEIRIQRRATFDHIRYIKAIIANRQALTDGLTSSKRICSPGVGLTQTSCKMLTPHRTLRPNRHDSV